MAFSSAVVAANDYISGRLQPVTPSESEVVAVRYEADFGKDAANIAANLGLNKVGAIGILPAGCVPVGLIVDSDDLDSTSALAWSIGLSNTSNASAPGYDATDVSIATNDGGAVWASGITVSQAGGQVQPLSKALSRVVPVNYDRAIVVKATTASNTSGITSGKLGVTVLYRAANSYAPY